MPTDPGQRILSDADQRALSALADKFWDSANFVVTVAVVQTIVFLMALGTNETLDRQIKCKDGWGITMVLMVLAFGLYLFLLRRYHAGEARLRTAAAHPVEVGE